MRWVIWLLLIFAAAVLAALFGIDNQSMVFFTMVELGEVYPIRFNLFILLAILAIIVSYMLIRLIVNALNIPSATRRWRAQRRERYSNTELTEAVLQYMAGRYTRSTKSSGKALAAYAKNRSGREKTDGTVEFGIVTHLLMASNAHCLGNSQERDAQAQKAFTLTDKSRLSEAPDAVQLLQLQWAIDDHDPKAARAVLARLDPGVQRRIATLHMQLEVDRMENAPLAALRTVRQLIKHKAYDPEPGQQLITELACDALSTAQDPQQLDEIWNQLLPKERKQPEVTARAAWKRAGFDDAAGAIVLIASCWSQDINALPQAVRSQLLLALDMVLPQADHEWLKRIEEAYNEKADDPMLAYLLGRLCAQQQLVGRAQTLLKQATENPKFPPAMRQRAWLALAKLAEDNADETRASTCYKQAALLFNA